MRITACFLCGSTDLTHREGGALCSCGAWHVDPDAPRVAAAADLIDEAKDIALAAREDMGAAADDRADRGDGRHRADGGL